MRRNRFVFGKSSACPVTGRVAVFLAALLALLAWMVPGVASAQESLMVTFDTTETGGTYAPDHCLAVWTEDSGGAFVKTIGRWCNRRTQYLLAWNSAAGAGDVDAVSGATLGSHGTLMVSWDLRDRSGLIVPDGTYGIRMELVDSHPSDPAQNNQGMFSFDKNGMASTQMTSGGGFNNVIIVYTGRTAGTDAGPSGTDAGPSDTDGGSTTGDGGTVPGPDAGGPRTVEGACSCRAAGAAPGEPVGWPVPALAAFVTVVGLARRRSRRIR